MSEVIQNISVVFELETSIKYLKRGLKEIEQITPENDFYHPVFVFLSGGFERLLKVVLTLNYYEKYGKYPSLNELIPKNSDRHNLEYFLNQFKPIFHIGDGEQLNSDYQLLFNDNGTDLLINPLSEFGMYGRYFDFDSILGKRGHYDPKRNWESFESQFFKDVFGEDKFLECMSSPAGLDEFYKKLNPVLRDKLDKIIRAICRQFLFGGFSSKSKQYIFQVEDFL